MGGKFQYRVRESHLRDRLAPLLSDGAHGVVKLDLALRGLALLPEDACEPGTLPPDISWEDLHDLVRDPTFYASSQVLKRKWVSAKLLRLEQMRLVRRDPKPGGRPSIVVLRDDASGEPFDDPGASPDSYVSVLGTVVAFGRLRNWRSPQIATYLACMIAERYARSDRIFAEVAALSDRQLGGGMWYRPLSWFADEERKRPATHVRVPFSERTLRRGVQLLKHEGLLATERIRLDPRTGKEFKNGPRVLYHNGFDDVRPGARIRRTARTKFRRPPLEFPDETHAVPD